MVVLSLSSIVCLPNPASAQATTQAQTTLKAVDTIPATPQGLDIYVTDPTGLLTAPDTQRLKIRLQQLDEAGVAQIAVLILPDTHRELSEFAPQILNGWGIQHKGKKDGLLVLVNAAHARANQPDRIFMATGYHLEGTLPDAVIGRLLDTEAVPAFQAGDFSTGITNATLAVADILTGKRALPSPTQPDNNRESSPVSAIIIVLFILIFLFNNFRRGGRGGGGGFGSFLGGFMLGGLGSGRDDDGFGGGGFGGGFGDGGDGGGGDGGGGGGAGR